jgi:GNAT superfamily N-acetyltransferase
MPLAAAGGPAVTGLLDRPAAASAEVGDLVDIRPAGPADIPAVRAFLAGLSPVSAYRRFFAGLGSPSTAFVRRLIDVDHDRRETLLALIGDEVVGMADSTRYEDGCTVELGVVMADAWQRLGLGPRLAREVLELAITRGATTLLVHALGDNARVARMLRRRWPGSPPTFEDGTLVWHLPLV